MRRERLQALLSKLSDVRIAVVGDLFLDKWAFIDPKLDEPSLETGLTAYQVVRTKKSPGAAGTVIGNLCAMGVGHISVVSMLGQDGDGHDVRTMLRARGVDVSHVVECGEIVTPTYFKPMFLQADGTAVEGNRLDFKNRNKTPSHIEKALIDSAWDMVPNVDAILVLDQLTEEDAGVVTAGMRDALSAIAAAHPDLLIYADSRAFIHRFRDITIKCNNIEAAQMTGKPVEEEAFSQEDVFAALDALHAQTGHTPFVTCNVHGVACLQAGAHQLVPAVLHNGPIDVCGAGDACSAGIVSALCAGATNSEAAFLANLTAGVTVRKIGDTGTASQAEILALYDEQFACADA